MPFTFIVNSHLLAQQIFFLYFMLIFDNFRPFCDSSGQFSRPLHDPWHWPHFGFSRAICDTWLLNRLKSYSMRVTLDRVSWWDMNTQAPWHSGYPQRSSWGVPTVPGTGIYTPRHSGRVWPDVAILTLNPTISLVGGRSKWESGSGISLRDIHWCSGCSSAWSLRITTVLGKVPFCVSTVILRITTV